MQRLQHRTISVKKVSITMLSILENNENKTTHIECLTANGAEKESDGPIFRFANTVVLLMGTMVNRFSDKNSNRINCMPPDVRF